MLEKNSKYSELPKMQVTVEDAQQTMRQAILDCAWPAHVNERQKVWLPKLARVVGIKEGRLYDIFAGEIVPKWHEGETILNRARERKKMKARWDDLQAGIKIDALNAEQARIEADVGDQVVVHAEAAGSTDPEDTPLPGIT